MGNFLCGVNDFILFGQFLQELFFFFFLRPKPFELYIWRRRKERRKERKKSLEILVEIRKDYSQFCQGLILGRIKSSFLSCFITLCILSKLICFIFVHIVLPSQISNMEAYKFIRWFSFPRDIHISKNFLKTKRHITLNTGDLETVRGRCGNRRGPQNS